MQSYIEELVDIQGALDHAIVHLREQQDLAGDLDHPRSRFAIMALLSNALRTYCWLEDRQRALAEEVGQLLPLRRR